MSGWVRALADTLRDGQRCVLVTVAGTRGSTPRETGARMLVTQSVTIGTIGGGQLEYQCTQRALALLGAPGSRLERVVLGANCGQCCGGVADILYESVTEADREWVGQLARWQTDGTPVAIVTARQTRASTARLIVTANHFIANSPELPATAPLLTLARDALRAAAGAPRAARVASVPIGNNTHLSALLETVTAPAFHIVIFGAGHVGTACARVLDTLDAQVTLIDERAALLDQQHPADVRLVLAEQPAAQVATQVAGTYYLVMTHDHALDLEICARILRRSDFAFCGLIGSRSKRRRFEKRLRALSVAESDLTRLTCPIGHSDIVGKAPAHIAVAVAAQIVALRERAVCADGQRRLAGAQQ